MSESTPSSFTGDLAQNARPTLTPDAIEGVLQDFRSWLQETMQHGPIDAPVKAEEPAFSWQVLVSEFTALRQEINLQTRSVRAQQEQSAAAVQQMEQALAALREAREAERARVDDALRPLLKTLVDTYDALALARREVARVESAVEAALPRLEPPADGTEIPEPAPAPLPLLPPVRKGKWWPWGASAPATSDERIRPLQDRIDALEKQLALQRQDTERMRGVQADAWQAAEQVRQFFRSVITGYTMGLQRLDRALAQHNLEAIACLGEPFDPECMEVVEVVAEPGRVGTEVLEEVRRGYLWRGRLFRHAQVRVARP